MHGLGNRPAPEPAPARTDPGVLHFFSIPHWTRRILPVARKSHAPTPPTPTPRRLLLEKDLPPTPPSQADADLTSSARVSISLHQASNAPSQPTVHLDVYHNTSIIPAPSQINPVALTSSPNNTNDNALRKTKSTLSLRSKPPSPSLEQQRTRGVSMTQMFTTAKRIQPSPRATDGNTPSTPLVRKSSFWSRKPSPSSSQHLTVPADSPSLPVLKPTSPLRVDFTASPDSLARSRNISSGTGLSRRRSERAIRRPSTAHTSVPSFLHSKALPDRSNVRPSTADPYVLTSHRPPARRPVTADSSTPSRSRARSFFDLSRKPTDPPFKNESSPDSSTRRRKIGLPNPRPRSSTNPPLFHRFSANLFASSPSTPRNGVIPFPSSLSPRSSLSQIPSEVLKPRSGETSEAFVNRLVCLVSKADITLVLASTGEPIYAASLELFMERFEFHGEPLDVALRRLLMNVGLPRETQQIDRVIEAFANRYLSCNPDLFTSKDHPYILAFSLIMLHTDAFNKSNRRKMSKADYIKNTTLPGLIPEVLDCFYDNTVFAPFIFIEDPLDPVEGAGPSMLPSPIMQSGSALLSRLKIDPYYLIMNNLLDQLRVNVEDQISHENPFRWDGTGTSWNYDELLLAFAKGHMVRIGSVDVRSTAPFLGLSVGSIPSPSVNRAPEPLPASKTRSIKFTKVAILNRKDDQLEGGKKPMNRKWRPYSVVLTMSQLLLFRDLSWSPTLLSWSNLPKRSIPSASFKPDEIISLTDALAVLDRSYSKHPNTFRLTTRDGRHILFQATEDGEMNEWISRINYASTFKTTGIRMRSLGMTGKALELTGVAAATSHLHDLQLPNLSQLALARNHRSPPEPMDEPPGVHPQSGSTNLSTLEIEETAQFRETFDTVKAKLAATHISAGDLPTMGNAYPGCGAPPRLSSRSHMIHSRVEDLENRICTANGQINSSMHIARNIAILAPFQRSTRERLQNTIQTMSKKIQAMRLDVTKLICHRNILLNDLAAEEKNFKQATSLALYVATETLQQRYSEYTSQSSFSSQEHPPRGSFQEETSTGSQSFDSSTHEPFRSALDFGPDWPSSGEPFATPSFLGPGPSLLTNSPVSPGHDSSMGSYPPPDETAYLLLSTTKSLPNTPFHESPSVENPSVAPDFPEEQAEEWHKTRAAKRVSLVKLPPDLRMSAITGRSSRDPEDDKSLKVETIAVGDVT